MEKVQNAIIMAAGLGTRLRPITYQTPKPLIRINDKMIIETIIDALYLNDISNIYLIRGYMGECFDVLYEKYPKIKMLNNLAFDQGNNILSACLAGNLISNAFVMPADIWINNPEIFNRNQEHSNVLGYPVSKTDDWCIETDINGRIIRLSPGGQNCYKDTGIFYWNTNDGRRLSHYIQQVCRERENWEKYWSSVPFKSHSKYFDSYIRKCSSTDVIEIDTVDELIKLDSSYERYKDN